jgi:hypothetical protein
VAPEHEAHAPSEPDRVAVAKRARPFETRSVDEGPVLAPEVHERGAIVANVDARVAPRDAGPVDPRRERRASSLSRSAGSTLIATSPMPQAPSGAMIS